MYFCILLETAPNNVLLCVILKPIVDITVDALYTISSPYGKVLRIVIFTKKSVQAFIEFETVAAAQRAKEELDGKDIYPSCCTLKIEFAKIGKLSVRVNNSKTRDYTNDSLPSQPMIPNFGMMGMPFYQLPYAQSIFSILA